MLRAGKSPGVTIRKWQQHVNLKDAGTEAEVMVRFLFIGL